MLTVVKCVAAACDCGMSKPFENLKTSALTTHPSFPQSTKSNDGMAAAAPTIKKNDTHSDIHSINTLLQELKSQRCGQFDILTKTQKRVAEKTDLQFKTLKGNLYAINSTLQEQKSE